MHGRHRQRSGQPQSLRESRSPAENWSHDRPANVSGALSFIARRDPYCSQSVICSAVAPHATANSRARSKIASSPCRSSQCRTCAGRWLNQQATPSWSSANCSSERLTETPLRVQDSAARTCPGGIVTRPLLRVRDAPFGMAGTHGDHTAAVAEHDLQRRLLATFDAGDAQCVEVLVRARGHAASVSASSSSSSIRAIATGTSGSSTSRSGE